MKLALFPFAFVAVTAGASLLAACGGTVTSISPGASPSGVPSVAATASAAASPTPSPSFTASARGVRHMFVIVLENEGYATTFGPSSPATYLSQTLVGQGALLKQYYGTGHVSLDNYVAMVSGQPPDKATGSDCALYADFISVGTTSDGLAIGDGCVYPAAVKTIADQLQGAGLTWKGYMGDMGNDPSREAATCGHPALNSQDKTQAAEAPSTAVPMGDSYAARHDPFVYFHSIVDSPACSANVVNLNVLAQDLQAPATTPNYTFIAPSLCDDGHDSPCADGRPGGLVSADAFLKLWVPRITGSAAFQADGLLLVIFDEGGTSGTSADASACCNEASGPNAVMAGIFGPGGGLTGAVAVSRFIAPGTVSSVPYNHYSLLRSTEDFFALPHLGYAGQAGLVPFGPDIFTKPGG